MEASKYSFCSESALTTFAKKNGYDGFRELAIRVKVESEYYDFNKIHVESSADLQNNYRKIIEDSLNLIDSQKDILTSLIVRIKSVDNIYVVSSYQQTFNSELFTSELQLLKYNAFFNINRKSNAAWVERITSKDLIIVIAFGLDNQYIVNYYDLIAKKTNNIAIICSPSQTNKFNTFSEKIIVDYATRDTILESSRSVLINYLFSRIVYELRK